MALITGWVKMRRIFGLLLITALLGPLSAHAEKLAGKINSINPYGLEAVIGGVKYVFSSSVQVILSDGKSRGSVSDLQVGDHIQMEVAPTAEVEGLPTAPPVIIKAKLIQQ